MITYWHNPRCSKSREGLALLESHDADVATRRYLESPPNEAELRAVHAQLGCPVIDMVRTGERAFKDAGLTRDASDNQLFAAMAAHPILIERPIAMTDTRAAIGRPPENLLTLL
ncbi:arsenate reductase (glutaredoxin) [Roseovarius aestuarii]|nr:arsenate reductase (glutaredoxin) [Roseovarius aestuarii]